MSIDKHIEEMAKTVCHLDRTCDQCMTSFECKAITYAKRFYNAGYRKASEVAGKIIKDLVNFLDDNEKQMLVNGHSVWFVNADDLTEFIEEIKEEHTESEKDNGNI